MGAARAAALVERYRPFNLDDAPLAPLTKDDVPVTVAFLALPADPPTTESSWTRAPKVDLLPERFVLLASAGAATIEVVGEPVSSPLYVGPDPSAAPEESIHLEDGELVVPEPLRWLVDFDTAVAAGMGFKVGHQPRAGPTRVRSPRRPRDAAQRRREARPGQARAAHRSPPHRAQRLRARPAGPPTNNTEQEGAAYSGVDDADESFDDLVKGALFTPTSDRLRQADGQRLAEGLGVGTQAFARVRHSDGVDGRDALAMNTALWPATLGYFLETMMQPVFGDARVEALRDFFTRYVTGRGALPAFRVGAQPYGVLPTTAFSRMSWLEARDGRRDDTLQRLYGVLRELQDQWSALAASVAHVGASTAGSGSDDPHRDLLAILGLHPTSVEFHSRYAQSIDHLFNHLNLSGGGAQLTAALGADDPGAGALALLRALGYDGPERPAILDLFFHAHQDVLDGGLVDDVPSSETTPIRPSTTDDRNYLAWLADAARTSLEALRLPTGFKDDRAPTALLYLLLRHALILGYHDAGYRLQRAADVLPAEELRALQARAAVRARGGRSGEREPLRAPLPG